MLDNNDTKISEIIQIMKDLFGMKVLMYEESFV